MGAAADQGDGGDGSEPRGPTAGVVLRSGLAGSACLVAGADGRLLFAPSATAAGDAALWLPRSAHVAGSDEDEDELCDDQNDDDGGAVRRPRAGLRNAAHRHVVIDAEVIALAELSDDGRSTSLTEAARDAAVLLARNVMVPDSELTRGDQQASSSAARSLSEQLAAVDVKDEQAMQSAAGVVAIADVAASQSESPEQEMQPVNAPTHAPGARFSLWRSVAALSLSAALSAAVTATAISRGYRKRRYDHSS